MTAENNLILETQNLLKKFGEFTAVNGVTLGLESNICKGLIGPNGAGKTTFFNMVSGAYKPTSGKILFKGEDLTGMPPHRFSKKGISRSYQVTNVFTRLPVMENVRLAVQSRGKDNRNLHSHMDSLKQYKQKTLEILETVGLKQKAYYPADFLPHGDQRKLEIAIALATQPELLLLDEPTAGVSVEEVQDVVNVIQKIKETHRVTILIVEHKIDVIMNLCDSVAVMHEGQLIAEGTPIEITKNDLVQTVYLGGD